MSELPTLVECARLNMRLTEAGCIRNWRSAQERRPEAWEGRSHCRTCPIGAMRAGVSPAVATWTGTEDWAGICPRCRRFAGRLINRRLCVSCYNREREVDRGRNAKGGTPRLTAMLHAERLTVTTGGNLARVMVPRVVDRFEAIISCARDAKGPMAFGVPALAWPQRELALPGRPWPSDRALPRHAARRRRSPRATAAAIQCEFAI